MLHVLYYKISRDIVKKSECFSGIYIMFIEKFVNGRKGGNDSKQKVARTAKMI